MVAIFTASEVKELIVVRLVLLVGVIEGVEEELEGADGLHCYFSRYS